MPFEDLRGFLMVAQHGSFLSAAIEMGVSRTTLRRQVEALEARTGVPLLDRRRKGVALTDAGRELAKSGRLLDDQFELLMRSVRDVGARPEGEVRCLLPVGLPPALVAIVYRIFNSSWPRLLVRTDLSVSPLDTNLSSTDVVVWFGKNDPGREWIVHTVIDIPMRLFAAKAYLEEHGTPGSVRDLATHNILAWLPPGEDEPQLQLRNGTRRKVSPGFITRDVDLLHECARMALGIAWAPDAGLPPPEGHPPFEGVLEELVAGNTELRLAVPKALVNVPKVRVFLEALDLMRQSIPGKNT